MNDNAYPQTVTLPDGNTVIVPGLTKLELISAMCLQRLMSPQSKISDVVTDCEDAITYAKELLKQLEAECGQE